MKLRAGIRKPSPKRTLSIETVNQIRNRFWKGEKGNVIAEDLGLNDSTVHSVIARKTYKDID